MRNNEYKRWIPALCLAAALLASLHPEPFLTWLPSGTSQAIRPYWVATASVFAWIFGAAAFNQLSRIFFFDLFLARVIGGPVPGVLKEIAALLVYLITVTLIVGLVFERSVTGFLAALGAGGVVLGFALRNLFADVFTGLAINIDRTFTIGDWVQINEGLAEPTIAQIREIGWRCTSLTTEEKTTVVIPNGMLGQERLINISQPIEPTRFEVELKVEYSVPAERVKRVLTAALMSLTDRPGYDSTRRPVALIGETSSLGVEYILRFWIHPWNPISPTTATDQVFSVALRHLRLAGIALAYPKTDIYHARLQQRQVDGHDKAGEIELLSRIELFEPLLAGDLERIVTSLARRVVPSGKELVRTGDQGDTLFVLIEGLLEVEVLQEGMPRRVAKLEPGQFFGEMSLLTGERRSATVRTLTESVVFEIGKEPLIQCMCERPELAEQLSRKLAERQLLTQQMLENTEKQEDQQELESFATLLLGRMRDFLLARRMQSQNSQTG